MVIAFPDEAARLESFGRAIDAIKADVDTRVGQADLRYVRRLRRFSRVMEVVGRALIHFSIEPVTFGLGVFALFLHKQVEATEIGHTTLHGAYDRFGKDTGFHSSTFHWKVPIDEESWRYGHNVRHHGNTNVTGIDPDIHFGPVRLTEHTPWTKSHRWQLWVTLLHLFPNFGFVMNLHFTGLTDLLLGNGRGGMDILPDRSPATKRKAWWRALRKYVPYYAYEYVLFPVLAGPFWWKVLLGNWLSETMRDVYSAATIFCGHIGEEVAAYPEGDKAKSRGAWYARQVEATKTSRSRGRSACCAAASTVRSSTISSRSSRPSGCARSRPRFVAHARSTGCGIGQGAGRRSSGRRSSTSRRWRVDRRRRRSWCARPSAR